MFSLYQTLKKLSWFDSKKMPIYSNDDIIKVMKKEDIFMKHKIGLLIEDMVLYERESQRRINHALKVLGYSVAIAQDENVNAETMDIIEAAAVLHDIGVKESINKYNSEAGTFQEIEGPAIARKILKSHNYPAEFIDRVCYLIAHHHTYDRIDDTDLQILVEADLLVTMFEKSYSYENILEIRERYFKTKAGLNFLDNLYLRSY